MRHDYYDYIKGVASPNSFKRFECNMQSNVEELNEIEWETW